MKSEYASRAGASTSLIATAVLCTLALLAPRRGVGAQACLSQTTRTEPVDVRGKIIRHIAVHSEGTGALPMVGAWPHLLRPTTAPTVIRRQLHFDVGQPADAELMAEALRRLRRQRLFADVALTITECAGQDSIDVSIDTRDAWTLTPVVRLVPPAMLSVGFDDRNLMGSARSLSVTDDHSRIGHGGSFALTDPWLLGTDVVGAIRVSSLAGNQMQRASLRHRELSAADPWRFEVLFNRQRFGGLGDSVLVRRALFGSASVGRIVGSTARAITVPYVGLEVDSAEFSMLGRADLLGGTNARAFAAAEFGVSRRAATFDTASWIVPNRGFLDVPLGVEGDVLFAPGHDRGQDALAARYDAWVGRMWMPTRGHLVAVDAWTSGFLGNVREDHISRLSVIASGESWRGFWSSRLFVEQLLQVDRDRRLMSLATISTDPTFSAVPRSHRFANRTAAASIERALHLRPLGRASILDGSLYAAASVRWDTPVPAANARFAVGMVGARLRVLSANGRVASTRLDIGVPVVANSRIRHRPLLSVSVTPLFDATRMRDGRRRHP